MSINEAALSSYQCRFRIAVLTIEVMRDLGVGQTMYEPALFVYIAPRTTTPPCLGLTWQYLVQDQAFV